ncbi:heterocyst frequency control protein PatD [Nodosilinea sp. LEGE 07088]|uniref:heterocyst frequency control protein PatD n=1 Tax=Nodosilinea sp. LEGE 07088 TaxID=2777968 RepID=UPI00187FA32D|nr:heterocyst frequency control protein PatD [Nodosilinea sp. LEGE 07088]MBE9138096.1 heterocyst frequency control protein PatD [Nodosilinea sp. LEGE 07088]
MKNALDILRSHLQALDRLVQMANPNAAQLQAQFLATQQHFQHQVLPLGDAYPLGQPALTEMNRTLRLLAMDVAFLQAARQPITAQRRQQQLGEKLAQLLGFCDVLDTAIKSAISEE